MSATVSRDGEVTVTTTATQSASDAGDSALNDGAGVTVSATETVSRGAGVTVSARVTVSHGVEVTVSATETVTVSPS